MVKEKFEMLLEGLAMLGTAYLGSAVNKYVTGNRKREKAVSLAVGVNYTDLDNIQERQILDFIHDEIIHSAFEGKTECKLSYDQLGLDIFDYGQKNEMVELFDRVSSNMFNEARFYSKGVIFEISDYILDAVNHNCTFTNQRIAS